MQSDCVHLLIVPGCQSAIMSITKDKDIPFEEEDNSSFSAGENQRRFDRIQLLYFSTEYTFCHVNSHIPKKNKAGRLDTGRRTCYNRDGICHMTRLQSGRRNGGFAEYRRSGSPLVCRLYLYGQRFCREFVYNQLYGSDHYLGRVRFQHFQNRHGTAFGGRIGRWTPPRVTGRKGRRRVLYPLFRQIWLR